jgi:hypothetical protein
MKPQDLLERLISAETAFETSEVLRRLLAGLARRKVVTGRHPRRMVLLACPDENTEEDLMPSLSRHLRSRSITDISAVRDAELRPNSSCSTTTDHSDTLTIALKEGTETSQQHLEAVFSALAADNRAFGGTRSQRGGTQVKNCAVKQFLLDCYLGSGALWQLMEDSFRDQVWIGLAEFSKAFEVLQLVSVRSTSASLNELRLRKKNLNLQRLLSKLYPVHFRLVEFAVKRLLSKSDLNLVVKMTLRHHKTAAVSRGVLKILDRLSEVTGHAVETITFKDFYYAIRHRR